MKNLRFAKMSGAGNDFVLLDWLDGRESAGPLPELARRLCDRRAAVGADGLLILRRGPRRPKLLYFNPDGSEAFCGNGARCAAWWLSSRRKSGAAFSFEAGGSAIAARVKKRENAAIAMPEPHSLRLGLSVSAAGGRFSVDFVDTGVPHAVIAVSGGKLADFPVREVGRAVRFHRAFAPRGANVNFVARAGRAIAIRTYERGVEDETLACGTGAVAAAIVAGARGASSPVEILARGGKLSVRYSRQDGHFSDVWLEGPARVTFEGTIGS